MVVLTLTPQLLCVVITNSMGRVQVDVGKVGYVVTDDGGAVNRVKGTTWDFGSMVVRHLRVSVALCRACTPPSRHVWCADPPPCM